MFDWLPGRKKRKGRQEEDTRESVEIARQKHNLKRRESELKLIEDMAKSDDEEDREMALAMLSGRARDVVKARTRRRKREERDPIQRLMEQAFTEKLSRNPIDDIVELSKQGKALQGLFGNGAGEGSTLDKVLNSDAFAELGRGLGTALPGILAAGQRGRHPEALPVPAREAAPPAAEPPADDDDDDDGITPAEVIALFEAGDMDAAAEQLTTWAADNDANPEVAGVIRGLVEVNDRTLVLQLGYYAQTAADDWKHVAKWLVDHPDERRALIAAVRAIYFPPEAEAAPEDGAAGDGV